MGPQGFFVINSIKKRPMFYNNSLVFSQVQTSSQCLIFLVQSSVVFSRDSGSYHFHTSICDFLSRIDSKYGRGNDCTYGGRHWHWSNVPHIHNERRHLVPPSKPQHPWMKWPPPLQQHLGSLLQPSPRDLRQSCQLRQQPSSKQQEPSS